MLYLSSHSASKKHTTFASSVCICSCGITYVAREGRARYGWANSIQFFQRSVFHPCFKAMPSLLTLHWLFPGSELDSDCKKWRLVADILNDLAFFIDLLSPAFPGSFFVCACTSSILRCVVGVAGGATRTAITQHQVPPCTLSFPIL